MRMAPVLMVKNEEYWLARVLRPLVSQFGIAVVGDTGSTDRTRDEAASVPGVELLALGPLDAPALGQARRTLGRRALELGYDWMIMVDGDEVYHPAALAQIAAAPVPEGGLLGFTAMVSLDPDDDGTIWELADLFNRAAVMRSDATWQGEYPFESPVVFGQPEGFFYYAAPPGMRYHGVHVHRFQRSPHDDAVMYRRQKQFQFAMQDAVVPRVQRFDPTGWWA